MVENMVMESHIKCSLHPFVLWEQMKHVCCMRTLIAKNHQEHEDQ